MTRRARRNDARVVRNPDGRGQPARSNLVVHVDECQQIAGRLPDAFIPQH